MPVMPALQDLPVYIAAVGALGIAAFGIVDAFGKTLLVFDFRWGRVRWQWGLPFVGFQKVRTLVRRFGPALEVTYGGDYDRIIRQQYRAGRGHGEAPDTIRQGVRLGLPFLNAAQAAELIAAVWGLPPNRSAALAEALVGEKSGAALPDAAEAQALAARWATSLDSHIQAAFDIAEQKYQARAQFWAGVTAVALSLAYAATREDWDWTNWRRWVGPLIVGLAAVPLAPIAKDLSSRLSDALGALRQLNPRPG